MPKIARLNVFPVKSCDGVAWQQAAVLPTGAIQHDRQFALFDSSGKVINAKRTPLIQQFLLVVDPDRREFKVSLRNGEDPLSGSLDREADRNELIDWLGQFLSLKVSLHENTDVGFPDDLESPGPTVITTATLEAVADQFPELSVDDVRARFRANIEIEGTEPFWEDRLFHADKKPQPFRIGSVVFSGINPCQRCIVPTRDARSGQVWPAEFAKKFSIWREQSLPAWAPRERFDHFYRLSTNTRLLERGPGIIQVGDQVELDSSGR